MSLGETVALSGGFRKKNWLIREHYRNYVGMIERQENSPTIAIIERMQKPCESSPAQLLQEKQSR